MANGLVEHLHQELKAALYAKSSPDAWVDNLLAILLGMCSAFKPVLQGTAAEMVHESPLHLPADLVVPTSTGSELDPTSYIYKL